MTQYALAKASSACARGLIANIETDAANVKLDTITRLAKSLALTEIDLLGPGMDNITSSELRRPPGEPLSKTEPTEFRRRFARNLREKRLAVGLYQKALSKVAGVQVSAVGGNRGQRHKRYVGYRHAAGEGARRKGNRSPRSGEGLTAVLTKSG